MAKRLYIKELYDPRARGSEVDLDLVLVHGIDGDPVKSWMHSNGNVWPRDLLPQRQPRTRVLSFAYNGDTYQNHSVSRIRDNARSLIAQLSCYLDFDSPARPIIFIAHCLGGLIVKQALCLADNERANEAYDYIASATKCIVFFGTPHFTCAKERITAMAKSFRPLDKTATGRRGKVSPLVSSLIDGASDLVDISEDFVEVAARIPRIVSFYETRAWPGEGFCIVDSSRASMMIENEERQEVDANHVEMCQFEDVNDPTFESLCNYIERATKPNGNRTRATEGLRSSREPIYSTSPAGSLLAKIELYGAPPSAAYSARGFDPTSSRFQEVGSDEEASSIESTAGNTSHRPLALPEPQPNPRKLGWFNYNLGPTPPGSNPPGRHANIREQIFARARYAS